MPEEFCSIYVIIIMDSNTVIIGGSGTPEERQQHTSYTLKLAS